MKGVKLFASLFLLAACFNFVKACDSCKNPCKEETVEEKIIKDVKEVEKAEKE